MKYNKRIGLLSIYNNHMYINELISEKTCWSSLNISFFKSFKTLMMTASRTSLSSP